MKFGGLKDLMRIESDFPALLVDARSIRSFSLGSIPGAVNIPVNALQSDVESFMRKVPKETPIVVFCQSVRCGYDEVIGRLLLELSFLDVTVTDEGYAEYLNQVTLRGS
jgi:rhodanese-related sulfurtransferase